jgi:hypothetical protein
MSLMLNLKSVEDTELWKHIKNGFGKSPDKELADKISANLSKLCADASSRMKRMPKFHPEFTLHDHTHLVRVTELMAKILGKSLKSLNLIELMLLILSAHFHDQGMVLDDGNLTRIKNSSEFKVHKDLWIKEHPNIREIENHLASRDICEEERKLTAIKLAELEDAIIGDYVRKNHGKFSADYIKLLDKNNEFFEVAGSNIAGQLAMICESHVLPPDDITPENGFHHDELIGTHKVNIRFLALILRLADILDFDRDRTPDVLYRSIHFTNQVSIIEWEKHRSVQGWTIQPDLIRFDMKFTHPVYEKATRHFFDWIDKELSMAQQILRSFPKEFAKYLIRLPQRVDRSRIGPKDNSYVYHDLEFSLSRDEVVKLLMMDNLYSSPSLCVRELLQNSLDALRYRKSLYKVNDIELDDGKIYLEHFVDEQGHEVLKCTDNGIGMDELVIKEYLTKVGRSYYRSPYFEQEKVRLPHAGAEFDPCSQFGIGFMSCFMIGDRILIETRRDYGYGRELGKPLIVEVNGLGGLVVIRQGKPEQAAGTTVLITSRNKLSFVDEWSDKIKLTAVIDGYALGTEFPIKAQCKVPEIADEINIPPEMTPMPTLIENSGIKQFVTFVQLFEEIDSRMKGEIRQSFLITEDGVPTLANAEASWCYKKNHNHYKEVLKLKNGDEFESASLREQEGKLCLDGILVCGSPGRRKENIFLGHRSNQLWVGTPYLLDVRGTLKPDITPSRIPPDSYLEKSKWKRLYYLVELAAGRIWEKLTGYLEHGLDPDEYWKLVKLYSGSLNSMMSRFIWEYIKIPFKKSQNRNVWKEFATLNKLFIEPGDERFDLVGYDGIILSHTNEYKSWLVIEDENHDADGELKRLIISMSSLNIENGKIILKFVPPNYPDKAPMEFFIVGYSPRTTIYTLPYLDKLSTALTIQCPIKSANRGNPLVQFALENQFVEKQDNIQEFALDVVKCLSNESTLDVLSSAEFRPTRYMKYIAHKYFEIDWAKYRCELKPPYQIWLKNKGLIEIDESDFENWRRSK